MNREMLWKSLEANAWSGWLRADGCDLPPIAPDANLRWCGIGGSLLPSETLLAAFGNAGHKARWTSLASPEPMPVELQPSDQVVFASKSGKTLELWTWVGRLRSQAAWSKLERPPVMITQDDQNPLAKWARAEGWGILPIPTDVGGRYSAFTPIGTLPLAWMGRDPLAFLEGGREVIAQLRAGQGPWVERVWGTVELLTSQYLKGVSEWVLMPYCLRLEQLSAWWCQLVAESLGKVALDGTRRGLTPIRAVGPIDQHSQLQRWMAGPRNVGTIVLNIDTPGIDEKLALPEACPYPRLPQLQGLEILKAQAEGTCEALEGQGVPVLRWDFGALTERNLGGFMMAWQAIVGLTGIALEIEPFDQPAVEDGKIRTFKKLGLI